jgi:hypothetical protein
MANFLLFFLVCGDLARVFLKQTNTDKYGFPQAGYQPKNPPTVRQTQGKGKHLGL